ncbi:(2Fe-2S)-binding protein [Streptomyces roseirectus]|uniref:(2Fe-2S)-binding protein n=1 Tax=Streptomyces roseirectus TaxID=2768066 RepID=UPI001FE948A9|nr:(2Fe-2S)-binding protein [Streptomyces roseirectus]
MDLDPALAALRPLGGFFVLRTLLPPAGDPATAPPGPLPTLADAYEGRSSDVYGDPLIFRVRSVAAGVGAPEERVAASLAHQSLASRLWSAALGCAALYGRLPDLDPALLRWRPDASAPDDLWLTEVRPAPARDLAAAVLDAHLEPLAAALRTRHGVAPGLLRGNAGSALAGSARQLTLWARQSGRSDVAATTRALTSELFAHPLLAGTGTFTNGRFRRRSCCLYYRVPGGGLCGDCCLDALPRAPRLGDHEGTGR